MELSFVIPAFNEEKYIGNCLASIRTRLREAMVNAEIIVVNNGSTDRTKAIASSFQGVTIVDEPEKGLSRARQAGYNAASGDLIANIDADNVLPCGWIEKVLREFEEDRKMVALSGPLVYYDLTAAQRIFTKAFYCIGYVCYVVNHYVLRSGGMLQGGNFVLRRSALEKVGGYNTDIEFYGEDTDIARKMQKAGKIKFTFALPMLSSGRRLANEGVFLTGARYAINYVWVIAFKRPYTLTSTDIRVDSGNVPFP